MIARVWKGTNRAERAGGVSILRRTLEDRAEFVFEVLLDERA